MEYHQGEMGPEVLTPVSNLDHPSSSGGWVYQVSITPNVFEGQRADQLISGVRIYMAGVNERPREYLRGEPRARLVGDRAINAKLELGRDDLTSLFYLNTTLNPKVADRLHQRLNS